MDRLKIAITYLITFGFGIITGGIGAKIPDTPLLTIVGSIVEILVIATLILFFISIVLLIIFRTFWKEAFKQ